jgi:hypothetical protein
MAPSDYPIDLRADYPERSSRGWAALTIFLVKFLALIPHFFVLFFLSIAEAVVAFIAQVAVAIKGEYPPGMFAFVAGVLRWQTRVSAFIFSLDDRYPPFALQPDDSYPVDIVAERPTSSSRVYALFTVLVEILFVAAMVGLAVLLVRNADGIASTVSSGSDSGTSFQINPRFNFNLPSFSSGGLLLRQIAAFPHLVVLAFLGIAAFVIWLVVQWVILFSAAYPRGLFDFVAGYLRWQTRVSGYALGLSDRYPPFTLEPSIAAPVTATVPAQWYADPTGRHEYRYWDGSSWTSHVADAGQTASDPLGPGSAPQG